MYKLSVIVSALFAGKRSFGPLPESELCTGDTSKDSHSLGPVVKELVPSPHKRSIRTLVVSAHLPFGHGPRATRGEEKGGCFALVAGG